MIYTIDTIARDVRVALDQNMTSEALEEIEDVDTLALNDIIESKIVEAVTRVHSEVPARLLDHSKSSNIGGEGLTGSTELITTGVYWNEDDSKFNGFILLPDDFMRLLIFKMSDWERPVFTPIDAINDTRYNRQLSRNKGIRGTPQRPVCAISIRNEGRVLEFYSCKSQQATISLCSYMPYPQIDENDGIDICKRCYNAVIYTIAALTATTLGDIEKSQLFSNLAKSSLL